MFIYILVKFFVYFFFVVFGLKSFLGFTSQFDWYSVLACKKVCDLKK